MTAIFSAIFLVLLCELIHITIHMYFCGFFVFFGALVRFGVAATSGVFITFGFFVRTGCFVAFGFSSVPGALLPLAFSSVPALWQLVSVLSKPLPHLLVELPIVPPDLPEVSSVLPKRSLAVSSPLCHDLLPSDDTRYR